MLKVHLKRINVKENGHKEEETEDWTPEWFPPGIHYPCKSEEENNGGPLHSTYGQIDWMNNSELSSKDLHKAMFNMSRFAVVIICINLCLCLFPMLMF